LVILNFLLGSYLSRSLAAQGPRKIFTEKCLAHSGPLVGGVEDSGASTINAKKC
jgi:hypothetical protein